MKFSFPISKRVIVACVGLLALAAMSFAQSNPTLVVVNGASFKPLLPLAPGAIASAFPTAANGFTGAQRAEPTSTPLPTTLGNTQVLVNNVAAPLFFVSDAQINFQVPNLTPLEPAIVTVSVLVNGSEVAQGSMTVFPVSPGIFQVDFSVPEPRPGAILNESSALVTENNPAARGTVLQIFCTGLGALNGAVGDGQAAPGNPALQTQVTPKVFIGPYEGTVEFSGAAPGFVGLNQVNVRIPANALPGQNPLTIIIPDAVASEAVSVWIAQ